MKNTMINLKERKSLVIFLKTTFLISAFAVIWVEKCADTGGFKTHEVAHFSLTEEVLAGRPVPAVCNAELHTDYGGAAVRWGLTHHKESAADCCQACLDQASRAKPGEMRCNIWVYCPSEFGCFSPDIYEHKHQECWLKYVSTYLVHLLVYPVLSFLEIARPSWIGSLSDTNHVYVNCRRRSQNRILKTDILRHTETTTQKRLLLFHGFQVL